MGGTVEKPLSWPRAHLEPGISMALSCQILVLGLEVMEDIER